MSNRKLKSYAEEQFLLKETRNGVVVSPTRQNAVRFGDERRALTSEPVRLTPAWEARNLTNDELNFRNVTMEQAELETNPPNDKWNIMFLVMLINGIGVMTPWNIFINAKSYFVDYKLSKEYTHMDTSHYTTNFLSYIGIASQIPNLLFNWVNIFVPQKASMLNRALWCIVVELLIFLFTEALVLVDTSTWPGYFFIATVASVVLLNISAGIYQNTVYGLGAKLPQKYTGAIILGNNISGTFVSLLNIVTKKMSPNAKVSAVYYFIVALFVLFVCFDTFFIFPINRFYKYHDLQFTKAQAKVEAAMKETLGRPPTSPPYWKIFKTCSGQCFNVFFIFFVTLAIFPAIHSDVKQVENHGFFKDADGKDYFTDITCFLTFNFFAMMGNVVASSGLLWPRPKYLWIPVVLRAAFIPLFLACNYHPASVTREMPIWIMNDWWYMAFAISMAFTGGYYSSLGMMYCSKTVEAEYSTTAGMFGAACLVTGVFTGVSFSAVFPELVSSSIWQHFK